MGYYTRYTLTWKADGAKGVPNCQHSIPKLAKFCPLCGKPVGKVTPDEQIRNAITKAKENDPEAFYPLDEHGESEEPAKWYNYDWEMAEFSKQFPTVLFTMHGEGEESGDLWNHYFLNGKGHKVESQIVYDDFDPTQLVEIPKPLS